MPESGPVVEMLFLDERLRNDESLHPRRATAGSAALDLRACIAEPIDLMPGQVVEIGLGVAIHISDPGMCGIVAPRSGLGTKHGIVLANTVGIIDSDYMGELRAGTWNRGDAPYTIQPYERLFQLLIVPVCHPRLDVVDSFMSMSERGKSGFGSTGTL